MRASVACCALFAILLTSADDVVPAVAAGAEQWVQRVPPAVAGLHVRDSRRDREIFFDDQGLLAMPDQPSIEWQRIWSGVNHASPQSDFAVYDSLQDRIWTVPKTLRDTIDVWSLDLSSESPEWTSQRCAWNGPAIGTDRWIQDAAFAFDPVRHRVVTFGGYAPPPRGICGGCETNAVFTLSLTGTPTWTRETVDGPVVGRGEAAMTYDLWRDRMIIYGGVTYGPVYYDQTYALTLGSPMTWNLLNPVQLPPMGHSPIVTSFLDRMGRRWIMDGWALDLSSSVADDAAVWNPLPSEPTPSSAGGAWFEQPAQSRILKYDGDKVVALSVSSTPAWSLVEEFGRARRSKHIAFADVTRQRVYAGLGLLWGYGDSDGGFQWRRLDRDLPWIPVATVGPSARVGAIAVVDSAADRALVFGGGDRSDSEQFSDLWSFSFDSGAWTALSAGNPPIKRVDALGVFDPKHRRLIVHGGRYTNPSPVALGDTWVFDAIAGGWSNPPTGTYGDMWGELGIYDPVRDRVISLGSSSRSGQVHALPLGATIGEWTELQTVGDSPFPGVYTHSAAYDPIGDRIIVVGEKDRYTNLKTGIWALSLSDPMTWSEITPSGTPPTMRYGAQLVSDPERGRMLLIGGKPDSGSPGIGDDWALYLHDLPTGSLLSAAATSPTEVALSWHASESGASATIERRDDGASWRSLGRQDPDGSGAVSWIDDSVEPGSSYDYRVRVFSTRGERMFGETHVEVPQGAPLPTGLALEGMRPNPAVDALTVAFSLPEGGRTSFELIDLTGRRVLHREFDSLPPGGQTVRLDEGTAKLAAGLYFLRMHHGGRVLNVKAVVGM